MGADKAESTSGIYEDGVRLMVMLPVAGVYDQILRKTNLGSVVAGSVTLKFPLILGEGSPGVLTALSYNKKS
jgi:hypothetical protein